ncbi:MAG: hypothetical protein P8X42_00630 [Calditrichaceae bacterium]|jgi:uncharacterized membrane protein YwzB
MKFRKKLIEHIFSILLVSAVLGALLYISIRDKNTRDNKANNRISVYLKLDFIDFEKPFDRALLKDVLDIYQPENKANHDSLLRAINAYRTNNLIKGLEEAYVSEKLTSEKLIQLSVMYLNFILVYVLVMFLTYYGVQTFGTFRFIRKQKNHQSHLLSFFKQVLSSPEKNKFKYYFDIFVHLIKAIITALAYLVLFSPAYVIAYSMKTQFNTDTILFMIILAVISNGLLITYTNKFYSFLVTESRKGYVQTAIVKNLNNSYSYKNKNGISYSSLFNIRKRFPNHVFQHIFSNARYQYLQTIKEQASFLISGLIIIEMALNIQGHFTYELLRQLLYKNYDIVIVIILGIFYMVKFTEILVDWLSYRESLKYENIERLGV